MGGSGFTLLMLVLVTYPMGIFLIVNPKKAWWTMQGWKYKNPDFHEPSDTAYRMMRFNGIALLVVGTLVVFMALG